MKKVAKGLLIENDNVWENRDYKGNSSTTF
jgi:hypothetical protein